MLQAFGARYLLLHGDAECLADSEYQEFRAESRTPAWRPPSSASRWPSGASLARGLRAASEARKQDPAQDWADVDAATAAAAWLQASDAATLVHGHTHRPGQHGWATGGNAWC